MSAFRQHTSIYGERSFSDIYSSQDTVVIFGMAGA